MDTPPPDRCGYTWPEDGDIKYTSHPSCCWRETASNKTDYCLWHADPEKITKSTESLRTVRQADVVLDQNSPFAEILDGANLSGTELSHTDFQTVALRGADLSEADLSSANLSNAELKAADLSNTDLQYADLSDANLRYADLSDARLTGANLSDANFTRTNLSGATFLDSSITDLTAADLSNTDFRNADLSNAHFRDADLSDATFSGSTLSNAVLRNVDLSHEDLRSVDLSNTDLRDTDLPNADLKRADLSNADLREAELLDATLPDSTLSNADLRGANLTDADLREATVVDVSIDGATTCTQLYENPAFSDEDWDATARSYHDLKSAFSSHGLVGRARKMHVRERRARSREARATNGILDRRYLGSLASRIFTGYGVEVGNLATWMVTLFLFSTGVYIGVGIEDTLFENVSYSVLAFTVAPPSIPSGLGAQIVMIVETFFGTLSIVLMGYILGNRERF